MTQWKQVRENAAIFALLTQRNVHKIGGGVLKRAKRRIADPSARKTPFPSRKSVNNMTLGSEMHWAGQ